MEQKTKTAAPETAPKAAPAQPRLVWNDANMRSNYANVSNVTGGREEIVLVFGMNQAWQPGQEELKVDISERIVLSPFAAKRLAILLTGAIKAYETNFGKIELAGLPESSRAN